MDPYVQVSVVGTALDTSPIMKTKVVKNNGFNPIFDSEEFEFQIHCPEQAIVVFEVFDEDFG